MSNNRREKFLKSKRYDNLCQFIEWITERHNNCGGVTEIRTLQGKRAYIGYFDNEHQKELLEAILPIPGIRKKIPYGDYPRIGEANMYFSLQVVDPDLLARAAYSFSQTSATSDNDIIAYHLFAVDIDPERKSGISATDKEKDYAAEVAGTVRQWFKERGIESILGDSGNGYHLLIPTIPYVGDDARTASENAHLLLQLLDNMFSTEKTTVDTTVYNPSRIFKLYGTKAVKGSNTTSRPHRWASIDLTNIPEDLDIFEILRPEIEQFKEKPDTVGAAEEKTAKSNGWDRETWIKVLEGILQLSGLAFKRETKGNRELFRFEKCPYHTDHDEHTYECCVMIEPDGRFSASCKHDDKAGWKNFKPTIEWEKHIQSVKQSLGLTNKHENKKSAEFAELLSAELKKDEILKRVATDFSKCLDFPIDAMPEILRTFIEKGAYAMQCPPDYIGVALLACLGAIIGRTFMLQLKPGWLESTLLWVVIVGKPGTTKSPALKLVLRLLLCIQKKWFEEYAVKKAEYDETAKVHKKKMKKWEQSKSEGPPPKAPPKPICRRIVVSDTTVEALTPLMCQNPHGLILYRDELSGWMNSMNAYKGGKGSDIQNFLSIWSGMSFIVDRKRNAGPISVPDPYLAVIGSCQPEPLLRLLDDNRQEDGFASRLLMSYPIDIQKQWVDDGIGEEVIIPIRDLFEVLFKLRGEALDDSSQPRIVRLNGEANKIFKELMNDHYSQAKKYGLDNNMAAAWAKMEAYTARLALIIHLIRFYSQEVSDIKVDDRSVLMAAGLIEYFKAHVARLYGMKNPAWMEKAKRIQAWAKKHSKETVTPRDIIAARIVQNTEEARGCLDAMAEHGFGYWSDSKQKNSFLLTPPLSNSANSADSTGQGDKQ